MKHLNRLGLIVFVAMSLVGGCAQVPSHLKAPGKIQIMAWGGPGAEASDAYYRDLAEAGFTLNYSGYKSVSEVRKAMEAAQKAGVKISPELEALRKEPTATANALKDHPALGGYLLDDEPDASKFAAIGKWVQQLRDADPAHPSIINLLPSYANGGQMGEPTYQAYLDTFVHTVKPALISFDFYPIIQDGKQCVVRGDWYRNLEQVSSTAKKAGIPFWAFALSTKHFSYPTPTLAQLRLQMFTNLAYGARTLEYFTYWQLNDPIFQNAPVDLKGNRTPIYDTVKQMNAEIQGLAPVFVKSDVVDVGFVGALPAGTHAYKPAGPIEWVTANGSGALVSTLRRDRRFFLVIVNKDVNLPQTVTIKWKHTKMSGPIARVMKDGSLVKLGGDGMGVALEPGDVVVLSWIGRR